MRTDDFSNIGGGSSLYYVSWTTTGNNPNGGVDGDLIGKKVERNISNKVYSRYIYRNGRRSY